MVKRFLIVLLLAGGSNLASASEPVRIISLGDSITKAVRQGVKDDETFSFLLQKNLSTPETPVEVLNLGIGGERTDQSLARLEKDVLTHMPQLVLVMYGHNDSYIDIGATKPRLTQEEYAQNLKHLVERIRGANSKVILMTPPAYSSGNKNGINQDPDILLEAYAQACREVATQEKVPLVDHYSVWRKRRDAGEEIRTLTTDGYHPNPEGQKLLTETILPLVKQELGR